ncbi:sugar ABC transporter substrate-binding protein [Actinoplanes aureus]|jgi:simple sugar transport system substrate-binding protein|uniref:Sugar ABC transporter substrate-binding protein n=1 Tax=Actinoplanes aureus TaxID=2792083 RepID=A0A931C7F1_9ACTN|nr:sugar ABC transporter substrate-binding protein [Actinoplanes aureus]MBG0561446.1 sugar ABC transporter substrate-binding protein [Actinoplanes aureus]
MSRYGKRTIAVVLAMGLAVAAGACSSSGGKEAEENAEGLSGGKAGTPTMTVAMVTHAAPGDTFWDIIKKGAQSAASKDNVDLKYSADPSSANQATLIQSAIDSKVDGIAVTLPDPPALVPVVKKAIAAGIPVIAFNAGITSFEDSGALAYFGSDESVAGETAGARAAQDGAKHVLCVVQEQGQVQLEARCDGVQKGFGGGQYDKIYVNGRDMPSVQTTIATKLQQDKTIDMIVTLGAPFALASIQAVKDTGSQAKVATFDFNPQIPEQIKSGALQWAIDQQPFLQGYSAVDGLWLYKNNGNVLGGGKATLTGPYLVDKNNVDFVAKFAAAGNR